MSADSAKITVPLDNPVSRLGVTGPSERNLKMIREALGVRISARGDAINLSGTEKSVLRAADVIHHLEHAASQGRPLDRAQVLETLATAAAREPAPAPGPRSTGNESGTRNHAPHGLRRKINPAGFDVYLPGRTVRPATPGQATYTQAVVNHDLCFCAGPAGTGKTYLAVAAAVCMLKHGHVRKIVLSRPAVEAGERIGFLPGTLQEKVNPYLRPLLDALYDMMEYENVERLMAANVIEIVPLAFMRGRTLNDAFIILDEAQNTTKSQMLMFLTRMGHGSKVVVTGDSSQIDLEDKRDSGLIDAIYRLRHVKEVAMHTLEKSDIVRHTLVQRIVEAYGDQDTPQTAR